MEILTAAQMRAVEQAAIESGEVTGLELMERAGAGVLEAIFEEWPELKARGASPSRSPEYLDQKEGRKAVVLCGPGNNGGDGFVVARLLRQMGWEVVVFLYGDAEKLPPDASVNCERWLELGEVLRPMPDGTPFVGFQPALLIDALFGTGLTRPVHLGDGYAGVAADEPDSGLRGDMKHVSIDIPSGLCADSGRILGDSFLADLTVTFHRKKLGQVLGVGPVLCGKLKVCDIGVHHKFWHRGTEQPWIDRVFPAFTENTAIYLKQKLLKSSMIGGPEPCHKFSHGHALILAGGAGKTGAARLTARGALRIGAGLVTLGVPAEAQQEVASQITAIMMRQICDARAFEEVLKDHRMNALCLGPGLGIDRARELVPVALKAKRATVLDADALTAYSVDPAALFAMIHENCVLTPHAGEFARLFPDISEKLDAPAVNGPAYSKVEATREAAKRAGCVVLFKGPDTVIGAADGPCSISSAAYEREAPWLATAGSGDVLAGFITGLLARGFAPMQAAQMGAWLHVECALKFGPGLIAEDLPEVLPQVLKDLLA